MLPFSDIELEEKPKPKEVPKNQFDLALTGLLSVPPLK